ncbi:hypothetical protein BYT27DRAFT_7200830 [Phlegmacium glaucopus]|nr:hypothetical protein BYT27DRAFT_7200830 [Phlegmacium glaucopus]
MDLINPSRLDIRSTTSRRIDPPTSTLPSLSHLTTYTADQVKQSLQNLHYLYFQPHPEPSLFHSSKLSIPTRNVPRPVHINNSNNNTSSIPDSGYASAEEDDVKAEFPVGSELSFYEDNESDTESDLLRADSFERSFAIKWLTGFITRSDHWIASCGSESDSVERSAVLDQAIILLSTFTNGDEETEVALTRTFSFPLTTTSSTLKNKKNKNEIQVQLNDAPLLKEDHTSVGLQSWGSSILLAERICLQPSLFSLAMPVNADGSRPLRILELGAGTGMLSIVAAKILQSCNPAPQIIATDYHPEVLDNLARNVATNFPKAPAVITIKCLDWEVPCYSEPLDRPFDVILAADVIYHPEHATWIKQCVEKLLARPSPSSNCSGGGVFWLIIPVRSTGRHEGLDRTVDAIFPIYPLEHVEACKDSESYLAILEKAEVGRQGSVGRADEGGYKLFKIGWIN